MAFAEAFVSDDVRQWRQRLLHHPIWAGIEASRLRLFALQDWWLVREAYRLDALAVAQAADLEMQEILLAKLYPKLAATGCCCVLARRLAFHGQILTQSSRVSAAWP